MRRHVITAIVAILHGLALQAQPQPLVIRIAAQRPGPAGSPTTLITLASQTIIEVGPGDLSGDRLTATAVEPTCIPVARVQLASGRVVIMPVRDLVDAKIGPRPAAECQPAWVSAATPTRVPSDAGAMATIRAECAKRHPTDFALRNFCEEQQLKALEKLRTR